MGVGNGSAGGMPGKYPPNVHIKSDRHGAADRILVCGRKRKFHRERTPHVGGGERMVFNERSKTGKRYASNFWAGGVVVEEAGKGASHLFLLLAISVA